MIRIYPGKGLNRDRSVLGFNLLEPITGFEHVLRWIQISGMEPVTVGAGVEPSGVSGRERVRALVGGESRMSLSSPTRARLSGRGRAPLSGREQRTGVSAPAPSAPSSGPEPGPPGSGLEAPDLTGNEYDDEISGKERGWPKS